ncbi:hypothetical protein HN865_00520 [Candidatus Woesearchaeota archaeon]|jgi:hypothetical protein|nr:hypothetical protein [Candidatus Woesearchaeota archaeon]MBT7237323.1 hypothetical protein [Candidatus Woesearchaeota archaeon]
MTTLQEKYPIITELLYDLRLKGEISFMTPHGILKTLEPYLQEDKLYKPKDQNQDNDPRNLEQRV